ncbi:hypothetical protein RHGRI_021289 [Rhododendron griersonianum]|uniref:Uncharacterized protein n=1 Tax=Rhododendron griersonianum TaxID=479676 RepID=A0AAV6JP56_9ERIC|nr:hypothetical protein RHGRI_021289 [Rhododendron griersonianum]
MDQPPQLQPPKTFYLRNLLMWPVIFAILVHNLFPNHLPSQVYTNSQWTKLLFCYLISLFVFPLLSAIIFTHVASIKRLFITHLWVSVAIVLYNAAAMEKSYPVICSINGVFFTYLFMCTKLVRIRIVKQ